MENMAVVNANNANVIGHFTRTVTVNKFLGSSGGSNLFNLTSEAGKDLVYETTMAEVMKKGGKSAINVKVEYSASFINILLNGLTQSIWAPSTITISGDII